MSPQTPKLPDPNRRLLLKAASLAPLATLAPLSACSPIATPQGDQAGTEAPQWHNWSGSQGITPSKFGYPKNETELRELLTSTDLPVRCFGGSHSFSPLVPNQGLMISVEQMSGLIRHDAALHTATFGAGTRLSNASRLAYENGQSFINQPDIDTQSLAGAISTATHGTGEKLPSLSACTQALRLMTPDGTAHVIDESNPDLLNAARTSLGSFGVITEITFQNAAAYRLEETTRVRDIREAMDIVERERHQHRSIEMFVFPFGNRAIIKTLDFTDKPDLKLIPEDDNATLEWASKLSMNHAWLTSTIQRALGFFVTEDVRRGPSSQLFATPRTVRFNEMEYTVPAENGLAVLEEAVTMLKKSDVNVFFPIEYRYTAAEESWLSPFYRRAGASLSFHQYYEQDYRPVFDLVEPMLKARNGRPHWGKLNNFTTADARRAYERFDDFIALQKQLDPQGRMLNDYMKKLLGGAS
ncbi:FAD-linked oxidoreductase [gamma proteobacterium HdN1]|nr:FAD-linked oxidoreductase [gamma proteobacterium HdN1]